MKGILFRPEIWQAKLRVLEELGEAQTRRVVKFRNPPNPHSSLSTQGAIYSIGDTARELEAIQKGIIKPDISLARYQEGEVVYVKEKALYWVSPILEGIQYDKPSDWWTDCVYQDDPEIPALLADNGRFALERSINQIVEGNSIIGKWEWKSPLHMPEHYARRFVLMLEVKPQRVQEITEEDAIAEGCNIDRLPDGSYSMAKDGYAILWNSINPKYPWELNPWEFTYTLRLASVADIPRRI